MDIFAANARLLRLVNGYSQQEIADLLHVSRSVYVYLELGKKSLDLDQVYTLSSFYGVEPKSFITFDFSQYLLTIMAIGFKNPKLIPLNTIQKNIKLLRTSKGLSQEYVASTIHLSRTAYSSYETGCKYPDIHTLLHLASLFEVDIDTLINYDLCDEAHLIISDSTT